MRRGPSSFIRSIAKRISSATATIMLNDHAAYMGTKAGADHVIRCVAHEFGSEGVRANSISPGLTDTPMTAEHKEMPGLFDAFLAGYPLGLSVAVWTLSMLALDILDRRMIWRDYWIEWALAAVLILVDESAQWQVAAWMGARVPYSFMVPPILIAIAAFPLAAWTVGRLDGWRLGRK